MFSFVDKNYLNTTRDFNGRGKLLMGKTTDGRIVSVAVDNTGAISISGTGGGATAANQVLEIAELQTIASYLQNLDGSNITTSITDSVALGGGATALNAYTGAKKVTLINNDTIDWIINLNSANDLILPVGYAIDLYTTDPSNITVDGTSGFTCSYVVYA